MPDYGYGVLVTGWLIWALPFFFVKRGGGKAQQVDRRARWGILLTAVGFSLLWQGRFWEMPLPEWRLALSIVFFALAGILSWGATRALGKQWRVDAGLNAQHELVMSGPYRFVRHPIYTSMLCLICATGLILTPPLLFAAALVFAIVGTEIRVRIEDNLLASRFGNQFNDYRRSVAAYVPFVR
jgi:protein-S-isoprenylcysteine O-methyltransferase Ste14